MLVESSNKSSRVLELYQEFLSGKMINKREVAEKYAVNPRSIQRDIDAIRDFLADQNTTTGSIQTIEYDKSQNGYRLVTQNINYLSNGEMLAVCKILLASRTLSKDEIASLLNRLLQLCVSQKDKANIEYYFINELHNYIDPVHKSPDVDLIWKVAEAIRESLLIEVTYNRLKKPEPVKVLLEPAGVLFSDYYFYLMGVIVDPEKRKNFDKADDPFPTIYRIDRIQEMRVLDERYFVPYVERFKEGEYRNKIQYMTGGEIQQVEFKYYGPSIEAVLDRLPTAKVVEESDEVHTVKAEVFGKGILMWLMSQGSKVEVIGPENLKMSWLRESVEILKREDSQ